MLTCPKIQSGSLWKCILCLILNCELLGKKSSIVLTGKKNEFSVFQYLNAKCDTHEDLEESISVSPVTSFSVQSLHLYSISTAGCYIAEEGMT